ncbi:twin-arginine translocation signal domain-containing protein [Nakamurella sp. YIM 132087]|uniref:Twin-arginine translocation signal domain-containing protein n=1 Tax=Nakamurella alba TaxID=2665158 RepID=A0A7K1FGN5_9ACTN|nr:ferritin-like domain-containing protein [Nakamurella alba]MTD13287.1 twin-arginine translocation signal domain-containing protein [Nakamurella alba]
MGDRQLFGGRSVLQFRSNTDRRSFLKFAGLVGVGATLAGGGMLAVPSAAEAADIKKASAAGGDVDILNYALVLEYLEADFYAQGIAKGFLSGRELELITPIGDHEKEHVTAVTAAVTSLGGTPAEKPKITYPAGTFDSKESFLKNASVFEELGVTAYHGQVPLISSGDVLAAAASIAGVESRHAAVIATLTGGKPFPAPVEAHATMDEVLAVVQPLIG